MNTNGRLPVRLDNDPFGDYDTSQSDAVDYEYSKSGQIYPERIRRWLMDEKEKTKASSAEI